MVHPHKLSFPGFLVWHVISTQGQMNCNAGERLNASRCHTCTGTLDTNLTRQRDEEETTWSTGRFFAGFHVLSILSLGFLFANLQVMFWPFLCSLGGSYEFCIAQAGKPDEVHQARAWCTPPGSHPLQGRQEQKPHCNYNLADGVEALELPEKRTPVGGLEHFFFFPRIGMMIQSDHFRWVESWNHQLVLR